MSDLTSVQVRLEPELLSRLENWRKTQDRIPSRAEVLRACLERALPKRMPIAAGAK